VQLAWAASSYQERPEALQEASPRADERGIRQGQHLVDGPGVVVMSISLEGVAEKYLVAKKLSEGTRKEYRSTVTKWLSWGQGVADDVARQTDSNSTPVRRLRRKFQKEWFSRTFEECVS
jgi:hypothetical protein